ncbi:hypothetical protein BH09ACT7_BH09ACT7_05180 [soil metagenome]
MAAPTASAVSAAAATPDNAVWVATVQRALNRLAGWPGTPHNFVSVTNHPIDQALDTLDDQLDSLFANAPVGSSARWLPDFVGIVHLFVTSAVPNYSFSDSLNAMGDFLNRVVPPFTIAPGADTFAIITPYKIMGAAVVGTATVLSDMLNGIYDPAQWEIDVIKTTTGATVTRADLSDATSLQTKIAAAQALGLLGGDGGAFDDPTRAWDVTLPTWTAAQVNPFTIVTYVVLVAMYKRFQEMAALTTFTTNTTYDSWLYTISLGSDSTRSEYAAGTFHAVDPDGNPVDFFGVSQGGTYTSAGGALVTINTADGGFTYTNTLPGAAFFHRATSPNEADRYDTVNIPVTSADGVEYTLTFKIQIIDGSNTAPTSSYNQSNNSIDALGVVRGNVSGSDSDGDTLTYSLVGSSVNGLSGNSAYTKNGGNNGGIVTLNADGTFTYVSTSTAGTSQSFQVQLTDGHGGTTIKTVTVQNVASLTPANVNTSTQNVVTGSVPAPIADSGMFTYTLGTAPSKGSVTSWNPTTGAFTYTRNPLLGHTTTTPDVVTVIATDINGRTVTMSFAVNPTIANSAPVGTGVTTDSPVGAPTYNPLGGPRDEQHTTGALHASDANGDAVTFAAGTYTTAQGGSITVDANGTFTYDKNVFAPFGIHNSYWHDHAVDGDPGDTFTINVSDAFGATTAVTYGIPIAKLNAVPTLAGTLNGTPTVDAFGVRRGTINGGSDGDGDGMTYSLVNATGGSAYTTNGGIVTMTGTSFTYIPKVGVTSDSFQVQVNDGHGGVTTATVNLTGLTTPGSATNVVRTTLGTETGTLNIPSPSDTTGLGLTYSVGTNPSKGTVILTNTSGTYTYTYVRNAGLGHTVTNDDSFTINATDATGKTVTVATISVVPTIANNAPTLVLTTDPANVAKNVSGYDTSSGATGTWTLVNTSGSVWRQTTTGKLTASDGDGDPVTFPTTVTTTNGGSVTIAADGSFTYTINKDMSYFHAAAKKGATGAAINDTFTVVVSDGFGGTTSKTITVPTIGYNRPPTFDAGSYTALGVVWNLGVGDPDGDPIPTTYTTTDAGYSTSDGTTVGSGFIDVGGATWDYSGGLPKTMTIRDGYYVLKNGSTVNPPWGYVTTTLASTPNSWT